MALVEKYCIVVIDDGCQFYGGDVVSNRMSNPYFVQDPADSVLYSTYSDAITKRDSIRLAIPNNTVLVARYIISES